MLVLLGIYQESEVSIQVNLDHVLLWGMQYIERIQRYKQPVFVDLKMNNGSRTISANDQEQPVTPTEALQKGANVLVCGTPIRKSPNPLEAMIRIYEEMWG